MSTEWTILVVWLIVIVAMVIIKIAMHRRKPKPQPHRYIKVPMMKILLNPYTGVWTWTLFNPKTRTWEWYKEALPDEIEKYSNMEFTELDGMIIIERRINHHG
jgi:hypothetical protein